jgi:ABC-type multidrug transport system fused ATPase/permease subunit
MGLNPLNFKNKPMHVIQIVRSAIGLLDKRTKRKYIYVGLFQILLSLLDLISVLLVGIIGALTLSGVQSQAPGGRTKQILQIAHLENFSFQEQVMILAILTVGLLVGKTIISVLVTRRTLLFLANQSAEITKRIINKVLSQPLSKVYSRGTHELHSVLGQGVSGITLGILGVASTLAADGSLLLILGIGLLVLSPTVGLSSIVFFGSVAVVLHFVLRNYANRVGKTVLEAEINTNRLISDALDLYRELYVRDQRGRYAQDISDIRKASAKSQAEMTFLPNISKYVIEIAVILGSVVITAIQFLTQTATAALASLGLFLIAGGRIAPALMRLQQSVMAIESKSANLQATLETIEIFESFANTKPGKQSNLSQPTSFRPLISMKDVCFAFDDQGVFLNHINLEVEEGSLVAVVGPSGSGKTTLINVLLGLLPVTSGSIEISGTSPQASVSKWPGSIAYVPQEVKIVKGTFRENIELGLPGFSGDRATFLHAVEKSFLGNLLSEMPAGAETNIGESGFQLSGGQRQRLGLARAFYTNPKLIILDEATSALDSSTEEDISLSLRGLHGEVTILVIAHRLSTVRDADKVVYLSEGKILASGTFDQVRDQIPDFDQQAKLMGL